MTIGKNREVCVHLVSIDGDTELAWCARYVESAQVLAYHVLAAYCQIKIQRSLDSENEFIYFLLLNNILSRNNLFFHR